MKPNQTKELVMVAIRKDSEKFDAELWAELYTLRAAVKGPDGYTSWQAAAVDERMKRHAAERDLASKEADVDRLRGELCHIVHARRFDREYFEDDTAFADWCTSRARNAIAVRCQRDKKCTL